MHAKRSARGTPLIVVTEAVCRALRAQWQQPWSVHHSSLVSDPESSERIFTAQAACESATKELVRLRSLRTYRTYLYKASGPRPRCVCSRGVVIVCSPLLIGGLHPIRARLAAHNTGTLLPTSSKICDCAEHEKRGEQPTNEETTTHAKPTAHSLGVVLSPASNHEKSSSCC